MVTTSSITFKTGSNQSIIVIPKEIHQPEGGGGWNDMELWKISNGDNEKNNSEEP